MTHQQLIDFWAEQVKKHELSAQNIPELAHEYKVLANQARLIYMQLCQMDCEEPITVTSIDTPDTGIIICNACKKTLLPDGVAVTHGGKYYHAGCFVDEEQINASK
jgi:hypothetical protein